MQLHGAYDKNDLTIELNETRLAQTSDLVEQVLIGVVGDAVL